MKCKNILRFYGKLRQTSEWIGIVLLLTLAGILVSNLGFPETSEVQLEGCVFTKEGKHLPVFFC